jgi:hypothetical protein
MDHRQLVRSLSAGRVVVGAALIVLPGSAAGPWIGPAANDPTVKVLTRAMGVRDLALGVGTMRALAAGEPARDWTLAGGVSDLVDAGATLLAFRRLGARRAIPLIVIATVAAVASYVAAERLD